MQAQDKRCHGDQCLCHTLDFLGSPFFSDHPNARLEYGKEAVEIFDNTVAHYNEILKNNNSTTISDQTKELQEIREIFKHCADKAHILMEKINKTWSANAE